MYNIYNIYNYMVHVQVLGRCEAALSRSEPTPGSSCSRPRRRRCNVCGRRSQWRLGPLSCSPWIKRSRPGSMASAMKRQELCEDQKRLAEAFSDLALRLKTAGARSCASKFP